MNFKDKMFELREDVKKNLSAFEKSENAMELEIETPGFFNAQVFEKRNVALKKYQDAQTEFNRVMSHCMKNKVDIYSTYNID